MVVYVKFVNEMVLFQTDTVSSSVVESVYLLRWSSPALALPLTLMLRLFP